MRLQEEHTPLRSFCKVLDQEKRLLAPRLPLRIIAARRSSEAFATFTKRRLGINALQIFAFYDGGVKEKRHFWKGEGNPTIGSC